MPTILTHSFPFHFLLLHHSTGAKRRRPHPKNAHAGPWRPQQEQQPVLQAASSSFFAAFIMTLPQHFGALSASTTFPHPQAHFQCAISNTSQ
jgi:hypothetical protein